MKGKRHEITSEFVKCEYKKLAKFVFAYLILNTICLHLQYVPERSGPTADPRSRLRSISAT